MTQVRIAVSVEGTEGALIPARGRYDRVTFMPSRRRVTTGDAPEIVLPSEVAVDLAAANPVTVDLSPSDGTTWYWSVTETVGRADGKQTATYAVTIPDSADVLELAELAHISTESFEPIADYPTIAEELDALDAAKANVSHSHAIADVTGLQTALNGKADASALTTEVTAREDLATSLPGEYVSARTIRPSGGDQLARLQDIIDEASELATVTDVYDALDEYSLKQTVVIPSGLYELSDSLRLRPGVDLWMHPQAVLRATAGMSSVIYSDANDTLQHQHIRGGFIDCANFAQRGIDLKSFARAGIHETTVLDYLEAAYVYGDPAAPTHAYEGLGHNLDARRSRGNAVPSGSVALWVRDATDCEFVNANLHGPDVGVLNERGGNTFTQMHPWGFEGAMPSISFDDNGVGATWIGCSADTPSTYGWRLRLSGARIVAPRLYRNNHSLDAQGTGIYAEAGIQASVWGARFHGESSANRWALDIGGPGAAGVSVLASQFSNIASHGSPNHFPQFPNKTGVSIMRAATGTADMVQWLRDNGSVLARVTREGILEMPVVKATGFTGATEGARLRGATASGKPTSGTYEKGDFVVSHDGKIHICTVAGTQGTWVTIG